MSKKTIIILVILLSLHSCEKGYLTDCSKCNTIKPSTALIEIYLTTYDNFAANKVTVYEGNIEDSIVVRSFTTSSHYYTISAMFYKKYSAMVEYTIDGKKYVAIDGACPQLRHDENSCEDDCYYTFDNIINLTLRYY